MNKLRMKLLLPALAVLALSLSSCNGTFWIALGFGVGSPDVSGKVVNAGPSAASFSGATVTLTNIDKGNVYHATVDSSGNWSVGSVKTGSYTASVSLSGNYFFTSLTAPFSYGGTPVTAPTIAGVYTGNLTSTVFILMWNNTQQLNLYLTAPDGTFTYSTYNTNYTPSPLLTAPPSLSFTDPNYDPSYNSSPPFIDYWANGFGPNGSGTPPNPFGRMSLPAITGFSTGTLTSGYATMSANTTSGYGPVAINLITDPTTDLNGFNVTGSSQAPSGTGSTYWQGVLEFYIDAPSSYISTSTSTTNATLYAVTGNGGTPYVLGVYTVPTNTNTNVKTLEALRINIFGFWSGSVYNGGVYQLVPQMTLVSSGAFRSAAETTSNGVVTVPRVQPTSK